MKRLQDILAAATGLGRFWRISPIMMGKETAMHAPRACCQKPALPCMQQSRGRTGVSFRLSLPSPRFLALCVLLSATGAMPLAAGPVQQHSQTQIRHYVVSGTNELTMLQHMRRHGPRVNGKPALASTRMRTRYTAHLAYRHGLCRVQRLRFDTRYTITLPRLSQRTDASSGFRHRWSAFVRRLKRHEQRHISIWNGCLKKARTRLARMSASSCAQLQQRMRATYRRIMRQCSRRHDRFDQREQHASVNLPFIRAAFALAQEKRRKARSRRTTNIRTSSGR